MPGTGDCNADEQDSEQAIRRIGVGRSIEMRKRSFIFYFYFPYLSLLGAICPRREEGGWGRWKEKREGRREGC